MGHQKGEGQTENGATSPRASLLAAAAARIAAAPPAHFDAELDATLHLLATDLAHAQVDAAEIEALTALMRTVAKGTSAKCANTLHRNEVEAQLQQQQHALSRQARMMEQTERLGEIGGWEWEIHTDAYYWTPQTYHIYGLTPTASDTAQLHPSHPLGLSFFTPTGANILQSAIQRAIHFAESFDLKLQLHNAQGQTLWVRLAGRPEVVDGQTVRLYGSIQDITLRTQIEEQLREAQKLDAIGQLAGGIAHDFNNLLTAINGMSELALIYLDRAAGTSRIDRVRNYINEIQRAGKRAAELTRQLLAFSRKQVLHPKVLDLRHDVTKSQDLLRQIIGDDIELVIMMPPQLGLVMADPSQIEQVIINLVINGRDAMPNGGRLTIRLHNVLVDEAEARRKVHIQPGPYVVLEVQDSGHGMTPEVQARLFDPFFTTKAIGEGIGLGLATVYGIVKQSGGTIEVQSAVGSGSTFRVYLPQSTPRQTDAKSSTAFVRGGSETVLLVGDDAWARQGYRVALEAKGYRILEAADGRAALTLCQSYVGPIHILVVSVLSDMNGLALVNQSHLLRPDMRVLLLDHTVDHTGAKAPAQLAALAGSSPESPPAPPIAQGEFFFLRKPFTPDAFAAKVRSTLDAPASMSML
jgi:signal transduction histidine kinase/CheY-like chemotaxis protein